MRRSDTSSSLIIQGEAIIYQELFIAVSCFPDYSIVDKMSLKAYRSLLRSVCEFGEDTYDRKKNKSLRAYLIFLLKSCISS